MPGVDAADFSPGIRGGGGGPGNGEDEVGAVGGVGSVETVGIGTVAFAFR